MAHAYPFQPTKIGQLSLNAETVKCTNFIEVKCMKLTMKTVFKVFSWLIKFLIKDLLWISWSKFGISNMQSTKNSKICPDNQNIHQLAIKVNKPAHKMQSN